MRMRGITGSLNVIAFYPAGKVNENPNVG